MNPWIILGIVVAWLASLVAVGGWQHDAGVTSERNANRGVQIEELKTANDTILKLEKDARASEHEHAEALAAIGAAHEADLETRKVQHAADLDAVRRGAFKLRDPGASACPDRGAAPAAPAGPGVGDGPPQGGLSLAATEFLLGFADDADAVVEQLGSCQAVVRVDHPTAKGAAP